MKKLEIFSGTKTYIYPSMMVATPDQIRKDFSAVNNFRCVIETDEYGEILNALESFGAMKSRLGISPELTDAQAISAMETIINTPPVVSTEPTAEERMASALEYQNAMTL